MNCRSSISLSGKQAGMPPTILSPVSFSGATLRKLDHRAGIAKVSYVQVFAIRFEYNQKSRYLHPVLSLLTEVAEFTSCF